MTFVKGQSGNPAGKKPKAKREANSLSFLQPMESAEMKRLVDRGEQQISFHIDYKKMAQVMGIEVPAEQEAK
jgi:hypothetical protein